VRLLTSLIEGENPAHMKDGFVQRALLGEGVRQGQEHAQIQVGKRLSASLSPILIEISGEERATVGSGSCFQKRSAAVHQSDVSPRLKVVSIDADRCSIQREEIVDQAQAGCPPFHRFGWFECPPRSQQGMVEGIGGRA
jgi:hypothetical protein